MFNEAECAERSVRRINEELNTISHESFILTINDGSKDKTLEILQSIRDVPRLVVVNHEVNKGYGGAISTAYKTASEKGIDYVLFMDADLTQDPKYLHAFVPKMLAGHVMIKGSRYVRGGGMQGVPLYRVAVSKVGNIISSILFRHKIKDYTNGFRAVRVDMAKKLQLKERGFAVLLEEIYQLSQWTSDFSEVPYILTFRQEGDGVSTFTYTPKVFMNYLKYPVRKALKVPTKESP